MVSMRRSLNLIGGFAVAAILMALALSAPVRAQDDAGELTDPRYPVTIHLGSCDELDDEPLFELNEAALPGVLDEGDDDQLIGPEDAVPALISDSTIDTSFDQFSGEDGHVVAVHRSHDEFGTLVACGPVGGVISDGEGLTFGLRPVDESGVSGVALFEGTDAGLRVRIYLLVDIERAMEQTGAQATPVANGTPDAVAATGEEEDEEGGTAVSEQSDLTLDLFDVGFDPTEFTIQANEDVSLALNNTGESMHNFSIDELDISVDIGPGQTQGVNINAEPGEYTFYCNVAGHREAGMEGTLFVAE